MKRNKLTYSPVVDSHYLIAYNLSMHCNEKAPYTVLLGCNLSRNLQLPVAILIS